MTSIYARARFLFRQDTAALMMANLAAALAGVVTGVVAARALGAEGRGDLAVVVFWPALFATLVDFGIADAVTLRCAREPMRARDFHRVAMSLAVGGGFVGVAIGASALPLIMRSGQQYLLAYAYAALVLVPVTSLAAVPIGALLGLHRFRAVAAARVGGVVIYTVAMIAAVALGHGTVQWLMWLTIASKALPGLFALAPLRRALRQSGKAPSSRAFAARQAREGASLHAARVSNVIGGAEDRAIASLSLAQSAIGIWQVPSALIVVMQFVALAVSQHLYAKAAPGVAGRGDMVSRAYVRSVAMTAAVALVAIPILPVAVPLVYGAEFRAAVGPGVIVMLGSVLAAGATTLQAASRAVLRTRECVVSEVVGILTMLGSSFLLVSAMGELGLALAYLVGRGSTLASMMVSVRSSLGWRLRELTPFSPRFVDVLRRDLAFAAGRRTGREPQGVMAIAGGGASVEPDGGVDRGTCGPTR